ncbi:MAG TPA: hypothetical protein VFD70_03265 [Anaerolineae bacterium]|nr:hypothetical protein [Anaerolineae bacterium]
MSYNSKPRWWLLYITVPFMVGAVLVLSRIHLPRALQSAASLLVILISFGAMALWMLSNQGAIDRADYEHEKQMTRALHRTAHAVRSRTTIRPQPATREQIPLTGFGSARFRPHRTHHREPIPSHQIRIIAQARARQPKDD